MPIFPWAVAEIVAMVGGRQEGLLVPDSERGGPLKRCCTLQAVKTAGAAMGIPGLTPHALRGTYATLLSLEGAQVKAIQAALRHKDARTTQAYIRPVMDSLREAGARVGERAGLSVGAPQFLAGPDAVTRPRIRRRGTGMDQEGCSL